MRRIRNPHGIEDAFICRRDLPFFLDFHGFMKTGPGIPHTAFSGDWFDLET